MRQADICKHLGIPTDPEVQRAYDAHEDAREAADRLGKEWIAALNASRARIPLLERLRFAATARCKCGAGFAYDPVGNPSAWACSAVLLGQAQWTQEEHDGDLPFMFYELKSERQPSACGRTTRPQQEAAATAARDVEHGTGAEGSTAQS